MTLVPVGFFVVLVTGGGSSGFAAWNDLVLLLGLMLASAVVGIDFSVLSINRDEQSVLAHVALLIHIVLIVLAVYALQQ